MIQYSLFLFRTKSFRISFFREINCLYSTIPIFSAYNSILSQTRNLLITFNSTLLINGDEFVNVGTDGCIPPIVTEAPTEAPEVPSKSNYMQCQ